MAAAIGVRAGQTAEDLRRFARRCHNPDKVRRLLAMALILDGGSRSDAAKVAGVTLQIVRDWVQRFNADGPVGLATRKAPGRTSILNDQRRARLAEIVDAGPIPAAHGVVRWRLADLAQWVWDEFQVSVRVMNYPYAAPPFRLGTSSGALDGPYDSINAPNV